MSFMWDFGDRLFKLTLLMKRNTPYLCISVPLFIALTVVSFSQSSPTVVGEGLLFGENDTPLLSGGINGASGNLELDVNGSSAFTIFSGLDPLPTFKAGEGNTGNGSVEIGKTAHNSIPLRVYSDGSVMLSQRQGDISMGVFGE